MSEKHERQKDMSEADAARLYEATGMRQEPGWVGTFTRRNAPGAMPAGTLIVKDHSEPGDTNPDGVPGVILGSLIAPEMPGIVMYFVEWASSPRRAVGCLGNKLRRANV